MSSQPAAKTPPAPGGDAEFSDELGRSPKVLWVVSSGGHLSQAHRIEGLIGRNAQSMWVTFDTPQSRSLLAGRRVTFVDYVAPRDAAGAIRASGPVVRLARTEKFDLCISTGSTIAAAALPRLAVRGLRTFYIESIARSTGPSLTGRLMRLAPRVKTRTQYHAWTTRGWRYTGSILDDVHAEPRAVAAVPRRVLVTLGTIRPYVFDRAVDAVLTTLRPDDSVTWQLGSTSRAGLPGESFTELPQDRMKQLIADADVVITHAGVGSILMTLDSGKVPVLMVRKRKHGEHVDDHQQGIADVMLARGLAFELDLSAPDESVLAASSSFTAVRQDA